MSRTKDVVTVIDGKKYVRHVNPDGTRGGLVPEGSFVSGMPSVYIDRRVIVTGTGVHIEGPLQILPLRKNEKGEKCHPKPQRITIEGVVHHRFLEGERPEVSGGLVAAQVTVAPAVMHVAAGLRVAGTGMILGRYVCVRHLNWLRTDSQP